MRKRLKNHFVPHEGNDYRPHFIREKNVVSVALIAVAIFNMAFFLNSFLTRHPDLLSTVITGVLIDITNSNRLAQNLNTLKENPTLAYAAQLKANDMAEKGYFAHNSPDGKSPWYWFNEGGYQFLYAGENLAVNFSESEDVVRAWMNSEGHRANILNDKFTEIGIAMAPGVYNGRDTIFVVQLFAQPAPQALVVAEKEKSDAVEEKEVPSVTVLAQASTTGEVASAEVEPVKKEKEVEVLSEQSDVLKKPVNTEMFIAVSNDAYVSTATKEVIPTNSKSEPEVSIIDKALSSPKTALEMVYIVLGSIIFIALIILLIVEPRRQHPKNIIYAILLLLLILVLLYFSKNYLFPKIIIE